ncbi:MAG: uL15 family ribosomal protein [Promethearchaeota archaeon]
MVIRRPKKSRKFRGSRTHGYGRVGQHRKKGQRGGSGKTGRKKHKWIWTVKYGKDYFGKHGFVSKTATINRCINISEIMKIVEEHSLSEIDVKSFGFDKVLGRGILTRPITIKAPLFSKHALEKIKAAGGQAIVPE